jgi:Flp pilus assembly protein TadG
MTQHPSRAQVFRRAATAAEFAIVAPIFFLFVLAIIELGRGLMVVHLLTDSARVGCRVGVIEGRATSDVNAAVLADLNNKGIQGETATIQVNDNTADASMASPGDEITVLVAVPTSSVSWVPGVNFLAGQTITGKYTLRRE